MDRSILSDQRLVQASRDFVCVRLATYEDEAEAEFLASVFRGRSGELENTVFALLAPDGETKLARAGRSPGMVYGHGEEGTRKLLAAMKAATKRYSGKQNQVALPLPRLKDLRLALNVAACDHLPLALVVRGEKPDAGFEKTLAELAWSESLRGRLTWAVADRSEAKKVLGRDFAVGLHIVAPDTFGLDGETLASVESESPVVRIEKAVLTAVAKHDPELLEHRDHLRAGRRKGKTWETAVPVTDPGVPPPGRGEDRPPRAGDRERRR